jgi:hypothetical protein
MTCLIEELYNQQQQKQLLLPQLLILLQLLLLLLLLIVIIILHLLILPFLFLIPPYATCMLYAKLKFSMSDDKNLFHGFVLKAVYVRIAL